MTRLAARLDIGRDGFEIVDDPANPRRPVRGESTKSEWSRKAPAGQDWKRRHDPDDPLRRWVPLVLRRAKHYWARSGFRPQSGVVPGAKTYPGAKTPRLELDDLIQAAWLGVLQALARDDESRGFATATLVRICVDRRCVDELRRWWRSDDERPEGLPSLYGSDVTDTGRRVELIDEDDDPDDVGGPPADNWKAIVDERAEANARRVDALVLLRELPPRQQQVFVLRRRLDLTQAETARRLGVCELTVRRDEQEIAEALREAA